MESHNHPQLQLAQNSIPEVTSVLVIWSPTILICLTHYKCRFKLSYRDPKAMELCMFNGWATSCFHCSLSSFGKKVNLLNAQYTDDDVPDIDLRMWTMRENFSNWRRPTSKERGRNGWNFTKIFFSRRFKALLQVCGLVNMQWQNSKKHQCSLSSKLFLSLFDQFLFQKIILVMISE